jgi:hypothetical protein
MKPIINTYLFSFALLCTSTLFGAASSSSTLPEQLQTTLHDDQENGQVHETMATLEERYQTAQQEQIAPASSSEPSAISDDRELKRVERTQSLETFANPPKRQRTQEDTHVQEQFRQEFIDAIAHDNIPELIDAYDQFGRSGGNTEELQALPELIAYLNGASVQQYIQQLAKVYTRSVNVDTILPLKKLLMMSPMSTLAYKKIYYFLQTELIITAKNNEKIFMPILYAKKYSKLFNAMLTIPLLKQTTGTHEPILSNRKPLEEPYVIDLSEFSKKTLSMLILLMAKAPREKSNTLQEDPLLNKINLKALNELWQAAEFLEVTEQIKYMIAASAINMVYTRYKGNFPLLDSLPLSAQNEIAKFSFLARPEPPSKKELAWRASKDFGVSIQQLIRWNRIPTIINNDLNLTRLHINDLTGLLEIPGIETVQLLNLSYNLIQNINTGTFTHLPHLRLLFLQGNPIINNPEERARIVEKFSTATNGRGYIQW